jgi:allantoicase
VSHNQPIPEPFAHLTDLSSDLTGTFVHYATDDYFAEKENLLKPNPPEWREGAYTDRGKWMDGWESQRKRTAGHDHCIIRLGTPGSIEGILCDTTHFKGNAPQEVSLDIAELPDTKADFGDVEWREVIARTAVKPDFPNLLHLVTHSPRATHVRFHIYPDGGVGRLRVYGRVLPAPRLFWQPGSIDLAAIGNGGTIAAVSDQFFGPPSNLLLPGRGVNMGDGWETKRRRTPGSDWCVLKLARRSLVERVELDTHFYKGNAPQGGVDRGGGARQRRLASVAGEDAARTAPRPSARARAAGTSHPSPCAHLSAWGRESHARIRSCPRHPRRADGPALARLDG